jgi:uroporphyrin-3 C-methyltransferase
MNSDPNAELPDRPGSTAPLGDAPTADALQTPAASKSASRAALMLLGVLALSALLSSGLLWQKVTAMQQQLARQSGEAGAQSVEARSMAKQAQELARETAARVAVYEARLNEVSVQRSQLEELMQSLSRTRDENLVVDIESAIRLAQQQAQLTGSVAPLLAALRSADLRVTRAAQPRLSSLREAMARDIDRIQSAAVSDTPNILVKLDELVRLADDLVLANAVMAVSAPTVTLPPIFDRAPIWWQRAGLAALEQARGLVRVSRIAHPEAALVSPEQSFFLRENLKLKLLNARLGLLARQLTSSRSDLAAAAQSLQKYFDPAARKTQAAVALLQQVQIQMTTLQLPGVDETLAALVTAAPVR